MNNRDCVSAERVVKNTTAKIVRHLIPAMFAIWSFVQAVKRSPIAALLSVTEKIAVVASCCLYNRPSESVDLYFCTCDESDLCECCFGNDEESRAEYCNERDVCESCRKIGSNESSSLEVEDMLCTAGILQVLPFAICDSHKMCSRKRILQ